MRRLGLKLLTAACCVSAFLGSSLTVQANEGPNSQTFVLDQNHPFSTGVVTNRRFQKDPADVYRFTIPSSGKVTLTAECKDFSARFKLYDDYGILYDNSGEDTLYVDKPDTKSTTYSLDKGSYYFIGEDNSWEMARNDDAKYAIRSLKFTPVDESFPEVQDGKGNNIIDEANEITPGMDVNGMLASGEARDYYKFTLAESGRLTMIAKSAELERFDFSLLNENGTNIYKRTVSRNNGIGNATLKDSLDLLAGTYYVCFESVWNRHGLYDFSTSFNPSGESLEVRESTSEMNDSLDNAATIQSDKEYYAQLGQNEESDFYEFTMISQGKPHLYFKGDMENVSASILNAAGVSVWTVNNYLSSGVNVIDKDSDNAL
jgi:hypothetical protein